MVTEPDAAAEGSAAANEPEATEATQPTYEELQERLKVAEQRASTFEGRFKSVQRSQAITGEALADVENRLAATMTRALKEAFETEDPIERTRKLGELEAERKQQAALAKRITDAQPKLDSLVSEAGVEFSDAIFDDTRTAWDNGRPEEALALARIAVQEVRTGNTFTKEEVEAMIEARLKNNSAAARVDSGGSTVRTGTDTPPTTAAELAAYMAQRRREGNPVPASEHRTLIAGLRN